MSSVTQFLSIFPIFLSKDEYPRKPPQHRPLLTIYCSFTTRGIFLINALKEVSALDPSIEASRELVAPRRTPGSKLVVTNVAGWLSPTSG